MVNHINGWLSGGCNDEDRKKLTNDIALAISSNDTQAVISSSDSFYWKERCRLAEKCLDESPCDPDITSTQIKAGNKYRGYLVIKGNKSY